MYKNKILLISDHALSASGVGVQSKYLIEGLLKYNKYSFIQLGAAIKHNDYETVKINHDFYIKPIDGFGNPDLMRSIILNEQPDAIIIFSDPRFFTWLFLMEDEIRQVCPILWWHVWDNMPFPDFNNWMYESVDAINCHSYLTYKLCKKTFPEKTRFIPHSFPDDVFYKMKKDKVEFEKSRILGDNRKNNFVALWINRNCKRKRPGDLLVSWKMFVDMLSPEEKTKVTLLMHTDPNDNAGQDLISLATNLNILSNVSFSTQKLPTEYINILHNISDICLNISFNEGFGLTTLESMMTGNPIIATKTGGLYRQVVDFRDNTENGIALNIDFKTLVGSQNIPYIYEDYASCDNIAKAIKKFYDLEDFKKKKLGEKSNKYAKLAFNYKNTIKEWDLSLSENIEKHKNKKTNIEKITIE